VARYVKPRRRTDNDSDALTDEGVRDVVAPSSSRAALAPRIAGARPPGAPAAAIWPRCATPIPRS
jgi:hypothetical protein